ncbi:hypothetical protein LUZ60_011524 [Juncus effusus]|nr:hypothetical protein LUZ60_011524 [Juncus effusus]
MITHSFSFALLPTQCRPFFLKESKGKKIIERVREREREKVGVMGENGENCNGSMVDSQTEVSKKKNQQGKRSLYLEDEEEEEYIILPHSLDPVKIELNRLSNEIKEKDRDVSEAQNEIKGLRITDRAKDKALCEVTEELKKVYEKLEASEITIENKNLEIRRINEEKREALHAQLAAEATLRRVHAAQKDDDLPPIEDILFPLEAEIKSLKQEMVKLQEDNKALERLTKTKEAALVEAEREVQAAKTKAALVDELQNKHQEMIKQNDICQEEYRILDKMHRKKVAEVEKMTQTVRDLEESVMSGAAAANAVRDYRRQVSELKDEKRTLERTLSRVMVTENRAATLVANEWKDSCDKVIPLKQWNEERRVLMGEMQQLRDKLNVAERTAKAEAQLKERLQLRLKVIEDGLKSSLQLGFMPKGLSRSKSINGSDFLSSPSQNKNDNQRPSLPSPKSQRIILKRGKEASKSFDGAISSDEKCPNLNSNSNSNSKSNSDCDSSNGSVVGEETDLKLEREEKVSSDDFVSIVFYDVLQREVIALRKSCLERDQCLKDKEISIEILSRKIDTLTKAMEVETRKLRREKGALEKELVSLRTEKEQEIKSRRFKGINCSS